MYHQSFLCERNNSNVYLDIGRTKWRSYEIYHPSICLFVRSLEFSDFLDEVKMSSNLKSGRAVFLAINRVLGFLDQNRPKFWFSSILKNCHKEFFISFFFCEVAATKSLKTVLKLFWEKLLCWCFHVRRCRNRSKMRFFKFYEKLILRIFLIFFFIHIQELRINWNDFSLSAHVLRFLHQNGPKMSPSGYGSI